MPFFSLGGADAERVVVTVLRHERAATRAGGMQDAGPNGHSGAGWLAVEVAVWAGTFSAQFPAVFLADDFERFHRALQPLLDSQQGEATFSTQEEQLFLRVVGRGGSGNGAVEVTGVALAWPGEGRRCEFRLALDRSTLARTLAELGGIVAAFPPQDRQQVLGF